MNRRAWLGALLVLGGSCATGHHAKPPRGPVVATVRDEAGWHCGTRCIPLAPGQVLRFDFGRRVRVTFTNEGVAYPLVLVTDGGSVTMRPGECCFPVVTKTAYEQRPMLTKG